MAATTTGGERDDRDVAPDDSRDSGLEPNQCCEDARRKVELGARQDDFAGPDDTIVVVCMGCESTVGSIGR